jgi:hypothetical protein
MLPVPGHLDLMNPAARPATPSTKQGAASQTVDPNHHRLSAQFHSNHAVGFQSQHFPDKRFHKHLVSSPLVVLAQQRRVAKVLRISHHCFGSRPRKERSEE